jgi:hypothetical protein
MSGTATLEPLRSDATEAVTAEKEAKVSAHAIGVINPYALAEVKNGKKINWKGAGNPRKMLEKLLGQPYEELFDPKHDSPLYPGLAVGAHNVVEVKETPKLGVGEFAADDVGGMVWADLGDFFEFGADVNDVVQGAIGDCYFLAALASVVWARTYEIAEKTRRTDASGHFVDAIRFFEKGAWKYHDVTEAVPAISPGNLFVYARSSQTGEIWPAIYEKAYAQLRAGTTSDQPDYSKLAYGDPVAATVHLLGLTGTYFSTKAMAADAIWQTVRANSISCKTFNPMVAWTYGTAPPGVNYNTAHIVANHAYSILGWTFVNGQEYVVVRNPWGNTEATLNVLGGGWTAWDAPYYGAPGENRTFTLPTVDGVFAIRADTFKSCFAGFGVVK